MRSSMETPDARHPQVHLLVVLGLARNGAHPLHGPALRREWPRADNRRDSRTQAGGPVTPDQLRTRLREDAQHLRASGAPAHRDIAKRIDELLEHDAKQQREIQALCWETKVVRLLQLYAGISDAEHNDWIEDLDGNSWLLLLWDANGGEEVRLMTCPKHEGQLNMTREAVDALEAWL